MRCWNCGRKTPANAKVCPACEADLTETPTDEEVELVQELLQGMDSEMLEELRRIAGQSDSAEEFANRIMVGDCPQCGSSETGDCETDPEIDNITIGRCYSCGQLWCTLCEQLLAPGEKTCDCDDELE